MTQPSRALIVLLHAAFFLTGISTVLIGQVLPVLSKRLALNDAEAGQFFVAQLTGSLSGAFIYNFLVKKFGFVSPTLLGMFSISFGVLFLNFDSRWVCAAGFFLIGIGTGTTLPSINMMIAEFNPLRTASALNLLNFFWGCGAIFSQPFVSLLSVGESLVLPTAILAALFLTAAGLLFLAAPKENRKRFSADAEETKTAPIWKNPVAWMIAVFNFLNVGMETGIGGWLTTYSARFPDSAGHFVSATPVFFLMFVVGRGFAPLFLRFLNENRFLLASLATLSAGILLTIFAESYLSLLVGAGVMGIGTSGIFPTNMARFTKIFGSGATRNATPIFVLGSLGGAYTTWLTGFVSNYFENLRAGFFVLLASSLVLILLQIVIAKAPRPALR
jgi:MFS transporter, FHS family, glucose/mannose:H+ symporter